MSFTTPTAPPLEFVIDSSDFVAVARYDERASAGPGEVAAHEAPLGALAFRRDWLTAQGISTADLFVIEVNGDSMAPDLSSGDLVLVDKTQRIVTGRKVFALVDADGSVRVKHLERMAEQLLLHSDNDAFAIEARDLAEARQVTIIGRVAWSGHAWRR